MKNFLITVIFLLITISLSAQNEAKNDSIMITVFLKHQQDKSLDSIQSNLKKTKFWENFPPQSARVVSWYVMMGIGQVVTLKIPAADLRKLNLSIEKGAWSAFDTEFYPTYDFEPIYEENYKKSKQ